MAEPQGLRSVERPRTLCARCALAPAVAGALRRKAAGRRERRLPRAGRQLELPSSAFCMDLAHWGAPHIAQSNRSVFWTSVKCRLENAGGMAPTLTSMAACSAWALALAY